MAATACRAAWPRLTNSARWCRVIPVLRRAHLRLTLAHAHHGEPRLRCRHLRLAPADASTRRQRRGRRVRSVLSSWSSSAAEWDRADRTSADQLSGETTVGDAFRAGPHDIGYLEGKNIHTEDRLADRHLDRLPGLVAKLVSLSVDAIITAGQARSRRVCMSQSWGFDSQSALTKDGQRQNWQGGPMVGPNADRPRRFIIRRLICVGSPWVL